MTGLTVFIPGIPQQQGSKTPWGTDTNANLRPWRADAIAAIQSAMEAQGHTQITGPVRVEAVFTFPRPKSHYGTGRNADQLKPSAPYWKTSKPDIDKLERALNDAITQSGAWRDDSLLACNNTAKVYATGSGIPGVSVTITDMDDGPDR